MQALMNGPMNTQFTMQMPFEDFLGSGIMHRQSLAGMCEPEVLILDYVHDDVDPEEDGELAQAFAEAAELASDGQVWMVQLEPEDVEFVRRRLCREHGMRLAEPPLPNLVA